MTDVFHPLSKRVKYRLNLSKRSRGLTPRKTQWSFLRKIFIAYFTFTST